MPFPNTHTARIMNLDDFEKDSFRNKEIAPGIAIVIGKVKNGRGSMVTESYHFSADKFTAEEARKWLKDHKIEPIEFTAATTEKNEQIVTNQLSPVG